MQSRVDIYCAVHKGLRLALFRLVHRLGALDVDDAAAARALGEELERVVLLFRGHQRDEDTHLGPLVERHARPLSWVVSQEHGDQRAQLDGLERLGHRLLAASTREERRALVQGLTVELDHFLAGVLDHMRHEEQTFQPLLWTALTDDELRALVSRMRADVPPGELQLLLAYMLPAINPEERAELLGATHPSASGPAHAAAAEVAALLLDEALPAPLKRRTG